MRKLPVVTLVSKPEPEPRKRGRGNYPSPYATFEIGQPYRVMSFSRLCIPVIRGPLGYYYRLDLEHLKFVNLTFAVGDYVYIFNPSGKVGKPQRISAYDSSQRKYLVKDQYYFAKQLTLASHVYKR